MPRRNRNQATNISVEAESPPLTLSIISYPKPTEVPESTIEHPVLEAQRSQFKRPPEEEKIFQEIVSVLEKQYRITSDGNLTGRFQRNFLPIGSNFTFESVSTDEEFRHLHVEPLLDQAADLLERAIRDRAEWDDKAVKTLNLALELNEYKELDIIHQEEEAEGFYELPFQQSSADYDAENASKKEHNQLVNYVNEVIDKRFKRPLIEEQAGYAARLGWLSGLVSAAFEGQTLEEWVKYTWDGVADTVANHALSAAHAQSEFSLQMERAGLVIQSNVYAIVKDIAEKRLQGLESKKDWDYVDRNFRRRRTQTSRKYQDLKARAASDPDGVLNYPKRMVAIEQRFLHDFREALARLKAIQPGLKNLYGYSEPFPEPNPITQFDDYLLWTRKAINFLIRFSRVDQNYVLPISLKAMIPEVQWLAGLKTGTWEFEVPEKIFSDQRHVRLRGINAFVVESEASAGVWQLTVRAPLQGLCRHLSNDLFELDQTQVPPCPLGRVSNREHNRDADVVGISALHNASPIGIWKVAVNPYSTSGVSIEELRDIQIDLHLSVRAAKP